MAIARVIKKRIRSTKNIKQITKAMQAVAAVKMRRSEEVALAARPFAYAALQMLKNVAGHSGEHAALSPLLAVREAPQKICYVVITSDKGLAGSFNANVLRASDVFLKKNSSSTVDIVAVGKKGRDYYARRGSTIMREFLGIGDSVSVEETKPISSFIQDVFVSGAYDEVHIVYTNFISALKQDVVSRKILPFTAETLEEVVAGITPLVGKYSDKGTEGAVHA
ncbi:MAG: F0F1 ATP synthase subunit gamma, partial [Methylomonas sp.]|nr:F0F1 ATP synthase subunit gamma [Methylomonas sp.]